MTAYPRSPRLLKGGIVLVNPETAAIKRIVTLQYNPDSLSRSLQVQGAEEGQAGGDRSKALRLTGPPVETYTLEAEIDATDQLEKGDSLSVEVGIQATLAALETIIYPKSSHLFNNNAMAQMGTLEIAPMESDLVLFIWNKNRIIPVRITEFSVTEEAFDTRLNPTRAKVNLGMRVLNIDDLGFDHKGGQLYMNYHQNKERLAAMFATANLSDLGINNI